MVVKSDIKQAILDLQNEMTQIRDIEAGKERFAELLSTIIYDSILSAEVVAGQTVTTPDTINGVTTTNGTLI